MLHFALIFALVVGTARASGSTGGGVKLGREPDQCKSSGSGYYTCGPGSGLGCEMAVNNKEGAPLVIRFAHNKSGPDYEVQRLQIDLKTPDVPVTFNHTHGKVIVTVESPCYQKTSAGFPFGKDEYQKTTCSIDNSGPHAAWAGGLTLKIETDNYPWGRLTDMERQIVNVHSCKLVPTLAQDAQGNGRAQAAAEHAVRVEFSSSERLCMGVGTLLLAVAVALRSQFL